MRVDKPLLRVALTGGPGGGKTTILKYLSRLTEIGGRRLFPVEETASSLKHVATSVESRPKSGSLQFQRQVINRQFAVEEKALHSAAISEVPAVILFDRGMFDSVGYISKDDYTHLLREMSLSVSDVLSRYDKIIFLRSAAVQGMVSGKKFSTPTPEVFRHHARSVEMAIEAHLAGHPNVKFVPVQPILEDRLDIVLGLLQEMSAKGTDNLTAHRRTGRVRA